MSRIDVVTKVKIYEVDGQELPIQDDLFLTIQSHWNSSSLVRINTPNKSYTVSVVNLQKAITNAANS